MTHDLGSFPPAHPRAGLSGPWLAALVWIASVLFSAVCGAEPLAPEARRFTVQRVNSQPKAGRKALSASALTALREAAQAAPRDRVAQFDLVMGLMRSGKLTEALQAAQQWRQRDAYNLVVVRLVGDLLHELKRDRQARRVWSAVVELLPQDPDAQRALATVFKQSGDLQSAYARLAAAAALRPNDARLGFELADAAFRLGKTDQATARFLALTTNPKTNPQVRYPAKLRLQQLQGGRRADLQVYLSWDTDRTDVDLWVTTPAGQRIFYKRKKGRFGGRLYDDVTSGYGPESFTAKTARPGTYTVQVNFYGTSRQAFREARGEVVLVTALGTPNEHRQVLPYRLFRPGQTVTVARVQVQ